MTAQNGGYIVTTSEQQFSCHSLVIASGGLTMPKLGATPIGYKIAEQFGLQLLPTTAALVPFTLHDHDKARFEGLSGISVDSLVTSEDGTQFRENILFTHRGLSGPAILQISSFWQAGQAISIDLLPDTPMTELVENWREKHSQKSLKNMLVTILPKRFIESMITQGEIIDKTIKQLEHGEIKALSDYIHNWQIKPNGTEGYRTAEGDKHCNKNRLFIFLNENTKSYDINEINNKNTAQIQKLLINSKQEQPLTYKEAA